MIAFQLLLKRVEDVSEKACDADSIYVIFQNQRWEEEFEILLDVHENRLHSVIIWWVVCTTFSGQLQVDEGILFILWRYERKLP